MSFYFFPPQTKCFICGIGSEYFDKIPHGFETHTLQEHNLANYLWVFRWLLQHVGLQSSKSKNV